MATNWGLEICWVFFLSLSLSLSVANGFVGNCVNTLAPELGPFKYLNIVILYNYVFHIYIYVCRICVCIYIYTYLYFFWTCWWLNISGVSYRESRDPTRYSGARGVAWLEHGGVWIDANIRGGGEYGPRWHQAAPWIPWTKGMWRGDEVAKSRNMATPKKVEKVRSV